MRSAFIFGFLFGLAAVLAGGYLFPWAQHERVASKTSVANNGGRRETFLIYLPSDRLFEIAEATGLPSTVQLPPELANEPLLAEHFKLRDVDGTVIGIVARHWSSTPAGPASVWVLNVPSRGTLVLAADGDVPVSLSRGLAGVQLIPNSVWTTEIEIGVTSENAGARVVAGTEEFGSVDGRYSETWRISGVDERGNLQGTIVLDTIVNQTS